MVCVMSNLKLCLIEITVFLLNLILIFLFLIFVDLISSIEAAELFSLLFAVISEFFKIIKVQKDVFFQISFLFVNSNFCDCERQFDRFSSFAKFLQLMRKS